MTLTLTQFLGVIFLAVFVGALMDVLLTGRNLRLHYVPRESYEAAKLAVHFEQQASEYLRRQLMDITAKYHQLRLQGAEPVAVFTPAPPPPKPIDPLEAAIASKYGSNPTLYDQAMEQLAKDQADNRSADDIMREILEGVTMDEGTPI